MEDTRGGSPEWPPPSSHPSLSHTHYNPLTSFRRTILIECERACLLPLFFGLDEASWNFFLNDSLICSLAPHRWGEGWWRVERSSWRRRCSVVTTEEMKNERKENKTKGRNEKRRIMEGWEGEKEFEEYEEEQEEQEQEEQEQEQEGEGRGRGRDRSKSNFAAKVGPLWTLSKVRERKEKKRKKEKKGKKTTNEEALEAQQQQAAGATKGGGGGGKVKEMNRFFQLDSLFLLLQEMSVTHDLEDARMITLLISFSFFLIWNSGSLTLWKKKKGKKIEEKYNKSGFDLTAAMATEWFASTWSCAWRKQRRRGRGGRRGQGSFPWGTGCGLWVQELLEWMAFRQRELAVIGLLGGQVIPHTLSPLDKVRLAI